VQATAYRGATIARFMNNGRGQTEFLFGNRNSRPKRRLTGDAARNIIRIQMNDRAAGIPI
jgi:hypothetical protein